MEEEDKFPKTTLHHFSANCLRLHWHSSARQAAMTQARCVLQTLNVYQLPRTKGLCNDSGQVLLSLTNYC